MFYFCGLHYQHIMIVMIIFKVLPELGVSHLTPRGIIYDVYSTGITYNHYLQLSLTECRYAEFSYAEFR